MSCTHMYTCTLHYATAAENGNYKPYEEINAEKNGSVEEVRGTTMRMTTEREEESKYASVVTSSLGVQSPPSLEQTVQYQVIDIKKTKVSWSHDTHMTQH